MTAIDQAATRTDPDEVMATLRLAFSADPCIRWLFPQTGRYHDAFDDLIRLAGGDGFAAGSVDVAYDGAAVAVWAPPGREPDGQAWAELFIRHVDPTRQGDVLAWGEEFGRHVPTEPCWHLAAMGVDPHWQGRGFGSELLRRGLERCDRDGLPAYLESGNPRNRVLYERHGFAVIGEVQVADSPPVWAMLRQPRP